MTFKNLLPLDEVDNYENPTITHHYKNHETGWEWWICAGEKIPHTNDYLFFGIGNIICKEMGEMTLSQIREYGGELDTNWKTDKGLYDIMED